MRHTKLKLQPALQEWRDDLRGQNSLIVESTLAGRGLSHHILAGRDSGFEVTVVMVFLGSAEVCVQRVEERVRKGGHAVPNNDIRRRYGRSLRNFWRDYRFLADQWLLVYNANGGFDDVAGGAGDIYNEPALFAEFLESTED
jgi:predicted ABC-type ATPase